MKEPLKIFIGWDSKEPAAFAVLAHSILKRATIPVAIVPLTRQSIQDVYTRQRGPTEATEFSLSRFLVPHLSGYKGHSVFLDSDMLCRVDLLELWLHILAHPDKALLCCQHDYVPKQLTKFNGNEQTKYPRKNWSSVMVFDNAKCTALTPDYVNTATGLQLHRFQWLSDAQIGALPMTFNWLVGEYEPNPDAKLLHYTNGSPCFKEYATCDHADMWWDAYRDMLGSARAVEQALQRVTV